MMSFRVAAQVWLWCLGLVLAPASLYWTDSAHAAENAAPSAPSVTADAGSPAGAGGSSGKSPSAGPGGGKGPSDVLAVEKSADLDKTGGGKSAADKASADKAAADKAGADKSGGGESSTAAAAGAEKQGAGRLEGTAGDVIYLPGPDGKLVPVPAGATLKEYLDWLKQRGERDTRDKVGPVVAHVTQLALDGVADDEKVRLTAVIEVHVTPAEGWVRVPLALPEGVLRQAKYRGPGEGVADQTQGENGLVWWFQGKGKHELTLSLSVPLKKQLGSRRLVVSLPSTAVSSLKLRVPYAKVTAKTVEKSTLSIAAEGKESVLEVFGLGSKLDLTWQPQAEVSPVEAVFESSTLMATSIVEGDRITYDVTQRVQALQGTFSELKVRLPLGFELDRLEGPEYQDHVVDAGNPFQIQVRLKKATSGPVELKWTIRCDLPTFGAPIVIDGFEVERARVQTGTVSVGVVGDFQVVKRGEDERFVQRVNLTDIPPALRTTQAVAAYRFLNQPFRLVLGLERIAPVVNIDPWAFVHFTQESVDLEAVYPVQVTRGTLPELRLHWPGWREAGWIIEPSAGENVQVLVAERDAPQPDLLRLKWAQPLRTNSEVRLRARNRLQKSGGSFAPWVLTLPVIEGATPAPYIIGVSSTEDLECELQGEQDAGSVRLLTGAVGGRVQPPREFARAPRQWYRVDVDPTILSGGTQALTTGAANLPKPTPIRSTLTLHQQEIYTQTAAQGVLHRGQVSVTEKLTYDVAFQRLSHIRLLVPAELRPAQVKFLLANGTELVPVWEKGTAGQPTPVQLRLDQPRLGRFDVEVRYRLDRTSQLRSLREDARRDFEGLQESTRGEVRQGEVRQGEVRQGEVRQGEGGRKSGGDAVVTGSADKGGESNRGTGAGSAEVGSGGEQPAFVALLSIPLIQPADGVHNGTRFEWQEGEGRTWQAASGAGWLAEASAVSGTWLWTSSEARQHIQLSMQRSSQFTWRIPRAWLRTSWSSDGTVQGRGQYIVQGRASSLAVRFPPHVRPVAFWWDRHRATAHVVEQQVDRSSVYEVIVPERAVVGARLLTIDFTSQRPAEMTLSRGHELEVPQVGEESWTAHTLWEISLPGDWHLFDDPEGLSAEHSWRHQGWWWSRMPRLQHEDIQHWLAVTETPDEWRTQLSGNSYLFSAGGAVPRIEFRTMSQPTLILIGAGLAFAAGLVLVKVPATRHVLTLLAVITVGALCAVWWTTPVLVLLQPASFGIVLACGGAALDSWLTRRRQGRVVTITSPSGFMTPASSVSQEVLLGVGGSGGMGSNEFAAVRANPSSPSDHLTATHLGQRP